MNKIIRILIIAACVSLIATKPAEAFDPYYNTYNNIIFFDDPNAATCATTAGSTTFSPTNAKIDSATLNRIKALKSVYEEASKKTGVAWQVYAAIDYRENNNDPEKSMLGGEPLGTAAVDSGRTPKTKLESILMGTEILTGLAKDTYNVDVKKTMDFDKLQKAFIVYNRGHSYKNANQSPDTSPYVMNQYDDAHKNMTFPTIPGETLAGRTETGRFGAMTIYANIATGGVGDNCLGAGVGAKVDYSSIYPKLAAGTLPASMLCSPRPSQPGFKLLKGPACDSFIAMNIAYKQQFSKQMPLSGGYRSAAEQIACGGTKANPGGANPNCIYYDPDNTPPEHLWGTAIDFSGPLTDAGSAEHKWLVKNGPSFGWFWPNWASGGQGGNAGVVENWHFAYYFVGHNPKSDELEAYK